MPRDGTKECGKPCWLETEEPAKCAIPCYILYGLEEKAKLHNCTTTAPTTGTTTTTTTTRGSLLDFSVGTGVDASMAGSDYHMYFAYDPDVAADVNAYTAEDSIGPLPFGTVEYAFKGMRPCPPHPGKTPFSHRIYLTIVAFTDADFTY